MKKADLFFNVLRLPVDFIMLVGAGLTTYFFRTQILSSFRPVLFDFHLPFARYFYLVVFVSLIFLGSYALSGLYSMKTRIRMLEEFSKILIASSAGILSVIIFIFLRQALFDSRFLVLGNWFFAVIFVSIGRLLVRYIQALTAVKYGFGVHRVVVIGNNDIAQDLMSHIGRDASLGYRIAGQLYSTDIPKLKKFIESKNIDEVILVHHEDTNDVIGDLMVLCQENHIVFKFIPTGLQSLASNFEIDIFKGLPLIEIKRTNLEGWGRVIKRVVDLMGSLFGLVLLSPLFGIVAFAIKWETEGPVFVKLGRVSGGNKEFDLYKFRSMIDNAHEFNLYLRSLGNDRQEAGPLWKLKNDPRITGVGRFIRRTRIDELPQLLNVVKGEMSIVGPRPHQSNEIERYERHHRKVLSIKSGITGLAQVSGSSDITFEEEVALDSFYIDNWSFWLDIKIILRTALKMFSDRSAV